MCVLLESESFADLLDELLSHGCEVRFRATGDSMLPFVRDGDVLLVREASRPKLGEVILAKATPDRLVAHRVIRIIDVNGQPAYLVKGDTLVKPDGVLTLPSIVGRIVGVDRSCKGLHRFTAADRFLGLLWSTISPVRLQISTVLAYVRRAR